MRSVLIIVVLAVLTGLSFLLMRSLQDELAPPIADKTVKPIATAYGVTAKLFGKDNQLQYHVQSPEVTEYSQQGGTAFVQPVAKVYDEKQTLTWSGRADKGRLSGDHDSLVFRENTHVTAFPNSGNTVDIHSEELAYSATEQTLGSDHVVRVIGQGGQQTADAYVAYLPSKQIEFIGNVKASYQPQTTEEQP